MIGTFVLLLIIVSGIIIFIRQNHLRQPFPNQEHPAKREHLLDMTLFFLAGFSGLPLLKLDEMVRLGQEKEQFSEFQLLIILNDCFSDIFPSIVLPLIILLRIKSYRKIALKNTKRMLQCLGCFKSNVKV